MTTPHSQAGRRITEVRRSNAAGLHDPRPRHARKGSRSQRTTRAAAASVRDHR